MIELRSKGLAQGFTIAELVVAISIITLLSAVLAPAYANRAKDLALERSANLVAQFMRTTIERALSATELKIGTNVVIPIGGYGMHFEGMNTVFLFADCNKDALYTAGSVCAGGTGPEKMDVVTLEPGISIKNLVPVNPLDVVFRPPDPMVLVNGVSDTLAEIQLSLVNDNSKVRKITVYSTGLVELAL